MNRMHFQQTARIVFCVLFVSVLIGLGILVCVRTPDTLSLAERRKLASRPTASLETIRDGSFFEQLEDYLLDQFPLRERFRRIKAMWQYGVFRQTDNHNIVLANGHAAEINVLSKKSVSVYIKRLNTLIESELLPKNCAVYTTVIPDKMLFLAETVGAPATDYAALTDRLSSEISGAFVDISDQLSLDCYYTTDTHWKESALAPVASRLLSAMGMPETADEATLSAYSPFYGVYYGRSALPLSPDTIECVHTDRIDSAVFYAYDFPTKQFVRQEIYQTEKLDSADAYDIFFGGAVTVGILENPSGTSDKTLYLFSDSFGRSLAPLLLSDYRRIVLYDIRYLRFSMASDLVPIEEGSDVLLAYSTSAIDVSDNLRVE